MNMFKRSRYTKEINRKVFRKPSTRNSKSLLRQLLESIVLTVSGIFLLAFLNWLPEKFDWEKILLESWDNFTLGSYHLFESILGFGAIILTLILIVLGIVFLLAGILRILRFTFAVQRYLRKRTRSTINLRRR